jgi:hypothetical protein
VTIDLFGKVQVGKTTLFNHFVDPQFRHLQEGGNLSYDFRTYYAKCWILPNRWDHSMVFLADPKFDMRWNQLDIKFLAKMFEPTNILMIVTDSTPEDVDHVKNAIATLQKIKRNLIVFVIANMQDRPGVLPVEEIQKRLGMEEVLGTCALEAKTKEEVLKFCEKAVFRYFHMLSKRGDEMFLIDDPEIAKEKEISPETIRPSKHAHLFSKKSSSASEITQSNLVVTEKLNENKEDQKKTA